MLHTIANAGRLLELFTPDHPEHGVSEVADTLGLSKSRAHELLASLAEIGLLRRTPRSRYRLGWRVLALGRVLAETTEFRAEAHSAMQSLVDRFAETVHLATLQDGRVVYVDRLQGTRAVRIVVSAVGSTLPAHCSGVGKVLLARLAWVEVERHLEQHGMERFTAHTITTPERLREELARVRRAGCAYDLEEAVLDVCCVAAPIVDHLGEAVAAISLSVPAYRFRASRERYRTAIVEAAASVSRRLGHVPAPRRLTSVAR